MYRYRDPQLQVGKNYLYLFEGAPWDDINLGILFCTIEAVYLADHNFNFFKIFRFFKNIFIKFSMNPEKT